MSSAVATTRARQRRRRTALRRRGSRYARSHCVLPYRSEAPRGSTLLALVAEVQQGVQSDAEVVRIVRWLVNSGAVVLTGSFAGAHF